MEVNNIEKKDATSENNNSQTKKIKLPIIALCLDLAVIPVYFFAIFVIDFAMLFILSLLLPIVGLIVGSVAFAQGKERTGTSGRVIALIAIALPLLLVAFIVVFFIGASVGLISLM